MVRRAALLSLVLAGAFAAPASAVTISSPTVTEGGDLEFSVTNDTLLPITVETADGTARAPGDYTTTSESVSPGTSTVSVPTAGDTAAERDEQLFLQYDPALGATVTGTGTIRDDDPPALSVGDAPVLESQGVVGLSISTTTPVSRAITVSFATSGGSAQPGSDYTETSGQATLPAGASNTIVTVPIVDDGLDEDGESFTVSLAPVGGTSTLADGTATVTIGSDNDFRTLSVGDAQVTEGDGSSTVARVPVTLSAPTFRTVTAQFATVNLSARAPGDYLARTGSVTIAPGQTTGFIDVTIASDDRVERAEQLAVLVGRQSGAGVTRGTGLISIADDDAAQGDDVPPDVRVTRLARSGSRALSVRVSCPRGEQRCTGRATFFAAADRTSKVKSLRRERRLGRKSFTLRGGQSRTLKLTVPRSVASAARRAGRLKVRAYVVTEDANDNTDTSTASRTIRFRR